jgi:hypothetical protein
MYEVEQRALLQVRSLNLVSKSGLKLQLCTKWLLKGDTSALVAQSSQ